MNVDRKKAFSAMAVLCLCLGVGFATLAGCAALGLEKPPPRVVAGETVVTDPAMLAPRPATDAEELEALKAELAYWKKVKAEIGAADTGSQGVEWLAGGGTAAGLINFILAAVFAQRGKQADTELAWLEKRIDAVEAKMHASEVAVALATPPPTA